MSEVNQRKCKVCQEVKQRILIGKYDNVNKKYVDLTGKCWNGNVCPTCFVEASRNHMRKLREQRKQAPVETEVIVETSNVPPQEE